MLKIRLHIGEAIPSDTELSASASRGVENLVIQHLREKNGRTEPNRYGLPKTNYWADAAKDVSSGASGNTAYVEIAKEGVALHYYGGTVWPKSGKKALALPIDPLVAGIWPSEYDQTPKHEKTFITPGGAVGDRDTGRILWILLPKATIKADPGVLPTDDEMTAAAENAIMEAMS